MKIFAGLANGNVVVFKQNKGEWRGGDGNIYCVIIFVFLTSDFCSTLLFIL